MRACLATWPLRVGAPRMFRTMDQRLSPEDIERIAHRRAGAKLGWYVHALVFVAVNLFVFAISREGFGDRPWSAIPTAGWGIGLALHWVAVFVIGAGSTLRQRLVEREREHLRRRNGA